MKNKFLSLAIVLCMLVGIMVIPVRAEITEGYFTYYITPEKEAIITKVDQSISGDVVIPSQTSVSGYWVRGIGERAFNGCDGITSLTIGDVSEIDPTAFMLSNSGNRSRKASRKKFRTTRQSSTHTWEEEKNYEPFESYGSQSQLWRHRSLKGHLLFGRKRSDRHAHRRQRGGKVHHTADDLRSGSGEIRHHHL